MRDYARIIWAGITKNAGEALTTLQPHLCPFTLLAHPEVDVWYVDSGVLDDREAMAGPNAHLDDYATEWDAMTSEYVTRTWESAQWVAALKIVVTAASPEEALEHQVEVPPTGLLLDWLLEDGRVVDAIRLGGPDCDPVGIVGGMYQRRQRELVECAIGRCGEDMEEPPFDLTDEEYDEYYSVWKRIVDER
jgi:hypothetical protein